VALEVGLAQVVMHGLLVQVMVLPLGRRERVLEERLLPEMQVELEVVG
jgi:hypothetical protein